MRVPTTSLRLVSLNFSIVQKPGRENWLILVYLLGGSWVLRNGLLPALWCCVLHKQCLVLSTWWRRGLLLGDVSPHPPLLALESRFPQGQATMVAPVIWWTSLALGDRRSEAAVACIWLSHLLQEGHSLKTCVDYQIYKGDLSEVILPYEELRHMSTSVIKNNLPSISCWTGANASLTFNSGRCIFLPSSIYFHAVYIYIMQDHS